VFSLDRNMLSLITNETYFVGVHKEIKNASECIVELYKHAGIFKNTREVHREARGTSRVFLKIPKCL